MSNRHELWINLDKCLCIVSTKQNKERTKKSWSQKEYTSASRVAYEHNSLSSLSWLWDDIKRFTLRPWAQPHKDGTRQAVKTLWRDEGFVLVNTLNYSIVFIKSIIGDTEMVVDCPNQTLAMIIMLAIWENRLLSVSETLHFATRWQPWFKNERNLTMRLNLSQ